LFVGQVDCLRDVREAGDDIFTDGLDAPL